MDEVKMRRAVVRSLERRGYTVTDISSGSGVPKWSRVRLEKDGKTLTGAIKLTTSGRILFTRSPDGTYAVLRESDVVLHAQPLPDDPTQARVSVFDQATIQAAFDANYVAKVENDMTHIPSWLNPEFEPGWRFTGSGFKDKALWGEVIPVDPGATVTPTAAEKEPFMDRVKKMVAQHYNVRLEQVKVSVEF